MANHPPVCRFAPGDLGVHPAAAGAPQQTGQQRLVAPGCVVGLGFVPLQRFQHPDPPVVGKHARFLFGLYSSFTEQRACYPYIFPTIFPRAAAGRSLHKRLRNLYCAPAT